MAPGQLRRPAVPVAAVLFKPDRAHARRACPARAREHGAGRAQRTAQAEQAEADRQALLAETRREAEQIRARADEQAKRILADAEARAKERQQLVEQQAEATARQIEERVMAQVRVQLADLVVMAVERVTRGALDANSQRGLVQQFLATNGAAERCVGVDDPGSGSLTVPASASAKRYASAAFNVASQAGDYDGWLNALTEFARMLQMPSARTMFMQPGRADSAEASQRWTSCCPTRRRWSRNFLHILADRARLDEVPDIAEALQRADQSAAWHRHRRSDDGDPARRRHEQLVAQRLATLLEPRS